MNRIDELFKRKSQSVLSIYFTAGYPELEDTGTILMGLQEAGADLVEIGFPFSDPVADGPVIQASSHQALVNGMNLDILFYQLMQVKEGSSMPLILMGYFNTVMQYGMENFLIKCQECGISGVILPDLPPEMYEKMYRPAFESAGIHFICLIAPQTSPERAKYLASVSRGFLYLLSSSSTTGSLVEGGQTFSKLPDLAGITHLPGLVGFGIHDRESFRSACRRAQGAIIGTAFIRYLEEQLKGTGSEGRMDRIRLICRNFVEEITG